MAQINRPEKGYKLYRRDEASEYLKEHWNVERSVQTLAKYASQGGGPKMIYIGRIPHYSEPALDAYACSIMSQPVSSTAELKQLSA